VYQLADRSGKVISLPPMFDRVNYGGHAEWPRVDPGGLALGDAFELALAT
jgi:hypothetical protein